MQNLSNQDRSNLRKAFINLKVAENYKGIKSEYDGKYQFNFIKLPDVVLSIKDSYKSRSAEAISYFASLPVFANKQTKILHLYVTNDDNICSFRSRFGYVKILLQETYNTKHNSSPLVHLVDVYGQTALHHACISFNLIENPDVLNRSIINQCAMIGMLLAHGADPELKDKYGKIPFDYLQEALSKIDPLILTKLDPNAFTFQALSSAYQNELNYEIQGQYGETAKKIIKEELNVDIDINFPPSLHLNLPKHGNVGEQYMIIENPKQLENITRWQDKVKEVVVPQVLAIPSSAENNSCRVGCVLF